ncbi:signal peptidase I [Arthrobacter sp. H14]|uniref:signal peptidase I n=1 Tax=Arthrobacter sp. H14 TaxID=1312959 RepID=UPI00047A437B|nr:signal peptidase I [Arthrobacter sp. H14]
MMLNRFFRRLLAAALMAVAVLLAISAAVLAGGHAAVVSTDGTSMNPVYYHGDLVLVVPASSYSVGQIVAYRMPADNNVVLHRIIDGDADGFVIKGDNSQSIDVMHPSAKQLIGRAVLHIPHGGIWLQRLTSPPMLALAAFALLAGGGTAITRRARKRRRKTNMSRHTITGSAPATALGTLTPPLKAAAGATILVAVLGAALAVPAWTGPLEHSSAAEPTTDARMVFSYTADVKPSPAYDDTTVESPQPVFRNLIDTVDVHYSYSGEPGDVTVAAELSSPGGWNSTIPLAAPESFTGDRYDGTIQLDLEAIEAKAQAAAEVTGLPAGQVSIAITPKVETTTGHKFEPTLNLNMTPLQVTVNGGTEALTVTGEDTAVEPALVPRTIGPESWNLTAATARVISAVMLVTSMLAGTILLLAARRRTPVDEGATIRRRYAALLVKVHPMTAPQGRPVIDVTTFATLAKLAERYGLLVLHWARSDVETFIVQDENTTYRYRTGAEQPEQQTQEPLVDAEA